MTDEEMDIYKHLEGETDRKEFINEFWKKRDPDPTTEENENRDEFNNRIAFANKWFQETSKGYGWDTARGRILLVLGFPDRREFGEASLTGISGQLLTSKRLPMERWYYYRMQLLLVFSDSTESGHLTLEDIPSNLGTMMDLHKFALDLREGYNVVKRSFRFDAKFANNNLIITMPVKKMTFEEKDGHMTVSLHATVYVYRNSKKITELTEKKTLSWTKNELLNLKKIVFEIPYTLTEKGKYYLDVVVEELGSGSKFRDFVKSSL